MARRAGRGSSERSLIDFEAMEARSSMVRGLVRSARSTKEGVPWSAYRP